MLAILIVILTEIPLQKQHIVQQLNTCEIRYIKRNIKRLQAVSNDFRNSFKCDYLKYYDNCYVRNKRLTSWNKIKKN